MIQKFDGGCFTDPANIKQAAELVAAAARDGYEVTSVVSASRQTSREWLKLARGLNDQPNIRELNNMLAANEQFATTLLSLAIESLGFAARTLPSSAVTRQGMLKDRLDDLNTEQLEMCLARGEIAVIGGSSLIADSKSCQDSLKDDSDLLAVALASALDAERCEYFVENDGVYTADPRLIVGAKRIDTLSYDEALELCNAGAELLSPDALELAAEFHMPLRIRSTANLDDLGTLVTHRFVTPAYTVCGIAVDHNMVAVNLIIESAAEDYDPFEGVSPVFARFTELSIDTDMLFIMSREDQPLKELGFVIKDNQLAQVLRVLEANNKQLGEPSLHVDRGLSRISVIGSGLSKSPEVVALIFETLNIAQIPIKFVATSELRMSLLLPSEFAGQAVSIIHQNVELLTTTDGTVQA